MLDAQNVAQISSTRVNWRPRTDVAALEPTARWSTMTMPRWTWRTLAILLGILSFLVVFLTFGLAEAEEAKPPPVPTVQETMKSSGDVASEAELRELRSEVVELRAQVEEQGKTPWFNPKSAVLTFLFTTGMVAASYLAADLTYGDSTRELMPNLTTGKVVGLGTLAAAAPAFVAGLGAGFDSPAVVSAGVTIDVLWALVPWGVGGLANGIVNSKYFEQ